MNLKFFTFLIFLLLLNCKKKEYEEFDFSYGNTFETDFSIKFNPNSDSVIIREHWSPHDDKPPISKTNYASKLSHIQRSKLDSFVRNINFELLDTLYYEHYEDGTHCSFYLKKNGKEKLIRVHSETAPKELKRFATWIYETKKSLKLTKTAKHAEFKSKATELEPPKAP